MHLTLLHIPEKCKRNLVQPVGGTKWLLVVFRSQQLQGEAVDLRERIKHLNDMVFCQQRKVKGMIEEVRRVYLSVCEVLCSYFVFCVCGNKHQLK